MHDRLIEAHARLSTLKMGLPDTHAVEEKYVQEFHDILQLLEQVSGCDLGGYRVPNGEVTLRSAGDDAGRCGNGSNGHDGGGSSSHGRRIESGNGGGENWCALEPAYERAGLMSRIDGVLHFFGVQATPHGLLNHLPG